MPPLVLIADNDAGVRLLLGEVVRRQGLQVECVADGAQASERLAQGGVDVFVCDLDMPRRTGTEVLEWLATQTPVVATVVVSGYVDAAMSKRLEALACVRAVLRKPFDVLAFGATVRGLAAAAAAVTEGVGRDATGGGSEGPTQGPVAATDRGGDISPPAADAPEEKEGGGVFGDFT